MWIWIVLAVLANRSLVSSMAETFTSDFGEDLPDEIFIEERSIKNQKPDDIEARRRSALDKNFMRFGRAGNNLYPQNNEFEDLDEYDEYYPSSRTTRTTNRNDNFIRFGRGRSSDFIRFGRDPYAYSSRETRGNDRNFIRFGRSLLKHDMAPKSGEALTRNRRDVRSDLEESFNQGKRHTNMLRFGRNKNFMRFGRPSPDEDIQAVSHVPTEKIDANSYPISILPLLKQLAVRLNHENKCAECSLL